MTTRSHSCVGCGEPPSRGVNRICRASVIERHLGKVFRDRCGSPAVAGFTTSYALIGLIVLIAFVAISLLADLPLQAASTPTTAPQKKVMGVSTPAPPSPIAPYVAQAYSIVGPSYVSTVTSQSITLSTGRNDLGIDLTGKHVVVIDQASKPLTLSAVQKGTRVYVCRKANNVVVMVLPAVTTQGGAKK